MIRLAAVADIVGASGTGTTQATSLLQDNRILWFLNRGTGVVLLGLLTLSVMLGVVSTLRTTSRWWPRFVTQALHRNISLLAVALLAAHVTTAVADDYVKIRWFDAFFPFAEKYRPLWGSLGTISLDLLLIVIITSLVRHRLGHRPWRAIHLASYASWLLGLIHGLGMGTDQHTAWSVITTAVCIALASGAVILRLATRGNEPTTQGIPIAREARVPW